MACSTPCEGPAACKRPGIRGPFSALALGSLLSLLAACGGGGGGSAPAPTPAPPPVQQIDGSLDDPTVYSSGADAALAGAVEAAAVTPRNIVLGGQRVDYTATAGHLIAREPDGAQRAQAKFFYVAYTLNGANPATRPVTFFYNGGPGSASVWLHLGSYGPRRLATGAPSTTGPQDFPLVDNADTLLPQTDLVFVNAISTGRSQAIAPFSNRSFWGVDADAAVFRDFVRRYLDVNQRTASPKFLFGESYGGPRTAVLARRLQDAGVVLDGLVLQSPALDYNSNCSIVNAPVPCTGFVPSYATTGAWFGLSRPVPTDLGAWVTQARQFASTRYEPAVQTYLSQGSVPADLPPLLADWTGLPAGQWQVQFNLEPGTYRGRLLPGQLLGRYDARMAAPNGSFLASEGDPSSTFISAGFARAIDRYLRDELRYRNASTYVVLSNAIQQWDFRHAGRNLPDTVPDLAAALAQNPRLRILAVNGVHDLATPFHTTELDLARLASDRVQVSNHAGGHMSYLDDTSRPAQRVALAQFYAQVLATRPASAAPERQAQAARERPPADRVGVWPPQAQAPVVPEPAVQGVLCDPCVPPRR